MLKSDRTPARQRTGRGKFTKSIETAERDAEACRLRSRGQTYAMIATALGYSEPSHARQGVERAMVAIVQEPAEQVRAMALAQLDMLTRAALEVLESHHFMVSQGRLMRLPGEDDEPGKPLTGELLSDDGPVLQAIDRLIKIQERRAKLLGLDRAVKVEITSIDVLDAQILELKAQLDVEDAVVVPELEG